MLWQLILTNLSGVYHLLMTTAIVMVAMAAVYGSPIEFFGCITNYEVAGQISFHPPNILPLKYPVNRKWLKWPQKFNFHFFFWYSFYYVVVVSRATPVPAKMQLHSVFGLFRCSIWGFICYQSYHKAWFYWVPHSMCEFSIRTYIFWLASLRLGQKRRLKTFPIT